jgi:hypothetical protein
MLDELMDRIMVSVHGVKTRKAISCKVGQFMRWSKVSIALGKGVVPRYTNVNGLIN